MSPLVTKAETSEKVFALIFPISSPLQHLFSTFAVVFFRRRFPSISFHFLNFLFASLSLLSSCRGWLIVLNSFSFFSVFFFVLVCILTNCIKLFFACILTNCIKLFFACILTNCIELFFVCILTNCIELFFVCILTHGLKVLCVSIS